MDIEAIAKRLTADQRAALRRMLPARDYFLGATAAYWREIGRPLREERLVDFIAPPSSNVVLTRKGLAVRDYIIKEGK